MKDFTGLERRECSSEHKMREEELPFLSGE